MRPVSTGLVFLLVAATALAGKPVTGKVIAITDGDTFTVLGPGNVQHKIRLAGIDAPERGQPFGTKARENLASKVLGQTVRVEVTGNDPYCRETGRVFLGERFINMEMVRDGFAWRYVQYAPPGEFTAAEKDALEDARGLWACKNPVPPWEWRKMKRQAPKSAH